MNIIYKCQTEAALHPKQSSQKQFLNKRFRSAQYSLFLLVKAFEQIKLVWNKHAKKHTSSKLIYRDQLQ